VDGLALHGTATARFSDTAMFYAGLGCCAGHMDRHEEALDALETLERAVALDPSDELARENLPRCKAKNLE